MANDSVNDVALDMVILSLSLTYCGLSAGIFSHFTDGKWSVSL